jgi:hypothetical protein
MQPKLFVSLDCSRSLSSGAHSRGPLAHNGDFIKEKLK